ncbi:hypothetical protein C7B82_02755 [Stenomitos frigidus ULC18]|uniref:eCIS core domain-containing protein n=2 Tax=Stenomitos TaxID=1844270 RepID=A0A2T1EP16_9CYAN|nr:hypothetical protein C7B82_02755 [Stenomitos frigidus ULC18]
MRVGEANDRYEQEADRLASLIVRQINAPGFGEELRDSQAEIQEDALPKQMPALQPKLQLKGESSGGAASPEIESAIANARGGGNPLEPELQERFGQAMGVDFSGVRVHTDAESNALNRALSSVAFTKQQDVYFREGAYKPQTHRGQALLAHELTHVVQQGLQFKGSAEQQSNSIQIVQRQLALPAGKSGFFFNREYNNIKTLIQTYNINPRITSLEDEGQDNATRHACAQTAMKELFKIQQMATKWLETEKNKGVRHQDTRRIGWLDAWYNRFFLPEYDRVDSILLSTATVSEESPAPLPRETVRALNRFEVASGRERDKSITGAITERGDWWTVIASESYMTTMPTYAYRVGYARDNENTIRSYNPRSARPIKPRRPDRLTPSEMMSYGHVYFALDQRIILPYVNMLPDPDEGKVKAIGRYLLPVGYEFKRDPEIPGGFRSTSTLPAPEEIRVTPTTRGARDVMHEITR